MVCVLSPCLSLTEQQRHLLQQQEQQLQQLQQLLASPQLTPEHQTVVYQMIQQIQQKRELQRLQMAGGSQLPMASLLAGSSAPLLSAGTPGLLPAASAPPLLPAGALVAPSLGNNTSLMAAAAAAAAAVAAAGGPPVLTAQTNPFLSLSGADSSGSGPKGGKLNQRRDISSWLPFCDGSHFFQRTGLSPLKFKVQETRVVALCTCKATQKPPYCDGTHRSERVQKAEVGSPL
ncbi:CDGSH iron-sulfur domain-containing protein 3, mitochondrial isoform X2 [Myotis lucifugus]|uniref:CDGSH iron-sulfur domain-containing protein 3, mitochondrial isoform X2 n=1 Tax=Myotis lucifugus TaxID=59463 RepID=UPI0006D73886|nr:CDGSH iron-sulfur domain-containing protein 3, mitochondrial isoform X2 [Myotis lucifugus]